jgi:PAS domain S-box-containing protein
MALLQVAEPIYRHPLAVPSSPPADLRTRVVETLVVFAGYWLLARLGLIGAIFPGNVTPICPAAGFGLAAMLLRGERIWPAIFLGQLFSGTVEFANFGGGMEACVSVAVGIAIAAGSTFQTLVAAFPLRRLGQLLEPFERVTHVFAFFAAIGVGSLISSTIAALALFSGGFLQWNLVGSVWTTWFVGDVMGQILIVPLILLLPELFERLRTGERIAEAFVMVVVVTGISVAVFMPVSILASMNYPLAIFPVPLVLWGAIRFEHIGATTLVLLVYLIGVIGTYSGSGPFETPDDNISLQLFHMYAGVTNGTALLLGASLKERRKSEDDLRATTNSLIKTQFAVDQAGDAVFILRPDSSFEYANLQAAKSLGYSVEQFETLRVSDIDSNYPAGQWQDFWEREIRARPMRFDSTLRRRDGSTFPVEISVNHLEIDGVERACAMVKDMTERHAAEQALRHTEARLTHALTAGNIGLWDWDVVTNDVYFSPQFKIQLGFDEDFVFRSYKDWESRLHPKDHEEAVSRVRDYLERRTEEYASLFRLRHRDGSYRWILSRGAAYRNSDGDPTRMIGVHIDISEQRMQNEELERSNLELQQFAYAASHDLQEPLRSIGGFTQLLQRNYQDQINAEADEWIDSIVQSAKRMKTLLDDLMSYTHLDSRSHPFAPVPMNEVVGEVVANLHSSIKDANATVDLGELPSVFGDRTQFVQLFQNLIGNAIKFHGDEPPHVRIRAEMNDSEWHFVVDDNGIGIDPKHHKTIFDVFRRLHHRSEQPGNGIGLAICRRIVHRHRGQIWVESDPGSGSRFSFTLPVDHRKNNS